MDQLEKAYRKEKLDHEREVEYNRDAQIRLKEAERKMVRGSPTANPSLMNLERAESLLFWSC